MTSFWHIPLSAWTGFVVSLLAAVLLVLTKRWHGRYSLDPAMGVQKVHSMPTPRVGGIAIMAGVLAAYAVARPERQIILGPLMLAGLPAFLFGLAEDLSKKVSVLARLLATMLSGVIGWFITGYAITSLDIPGLDQLLRSTGFSVMFTAFAIGGVANAINIIDGFNGLASGFVTLALVALGAMALTVGDSNLAFACFAVAAASLGFFVVNWPWGKLFLGDGGSYFAGFALAWAAVLLVERNGSITPFAALLVCIHPITEVLFSIYRRRLRHAHPGEPDRLHLHSLVMRRKIRKRHPNGRWVGNSTTGVLLVGMSVPSVLAAYLLRHYPAGAAVASVLFMLGYVTLYARLVRFKWCSPLRFLFAKPAGQVATKA
jgi:UDP-N-acetylmuramyl pentapeptide phosphotransferase/UDP-N-acetylglucosamine-1-phosphate transferase